MKKKIKREVNSVHFLFALPQACLTFNFQSWLVSVSVPMCAMLYFLTQPLKCRLLLKIPEIRGELVRQRVIRAQRHK